MLLKVLLPQAILFQSIFRLAWWFTCDGQPLLPALHAERLCRVAH